MASPTPDQIVLAAKVALCKKSYYHFFLEFWEEVSPEVFVDNWHVKIICDELQRMGERIKNRLPKEYDLVINVPPASSKSTIVTILYPVWLWTIDPTIKILSGSYGQSLAFWETFSLTWYLCRKLRYIHFVYKQKFFFNKTKINNKIFFSRLQFLFTVENIQMKLR